MFAIVIAAVLLWSAAALLCHPRELWDAPGFWTLAYPAALVLSGIAGAVTGRPAWRGPAAIFAALAGVMIVQGVLGGSGFGMLPFGLILIAVLALPGIALAAIAARVLRGGRPS